MIYTSLNTKSSKWMSYPKYSITNHKITMNTSLTSNGITHPSQI